MTKWDDFEAFCHVAEQGGFTRAAKVAGVSKSSLSAAIARLEESLNVRLLERSTRAVRLTEAGRFLYGSINPLFDRLRDARDETMSYSKQVSGTLRIAAPYEYSAHHLGAVACEIMQIHPQLNIQIDMRYAQIGLFDENYDLVFSMVDRELPSSSIIARRVLSLDQAIYASPELIASTGLPTRPADLAEMPLIAASSDAEWVFLEREGGREIVPLPAPRLRSSNADVRMQAAMAGLGVAKITATYCEAAVRAGALVKLLPGYTSAPLMIFALFPSRQLMASKVRVFLDEVTRLSSRA